MAVLVACTFGFASCKAASPSKVYTQAVTEIRAVTGARHVFHPDTDPAATADRTAELLDGGLLLAEAVELGLLNNPALQASFRAVGMAHADRVQASLLTNPSLNAVLRFPSSGGAGEFEGGLFGSLLDIWQVPMRERVAESVLERRILELAHRSALLAGDIRVAYAETRAADRLLGIAEDNRASSRQLFTLAEARLEAGAGTTIDTNLARVELLVIEVALRDAELAAGESRRKLLTLLGLGLRETRVQLVELPNQETSMLLPKEQLEELALSRRLDIRAAEVTVQQATAELEMQRSLFLRRVDLGIAAEKDGNWNVGPGLRIELPIFDQNQAQIAKALEALAQCESALLSIRLSAMLEVNSAVARAEASRDTLAIYREEIVVRSEETLNQARESYQLGKTTMLPALEAQRQLLAARAAYAQRLLQADTALSDLERATGTPRETLFIKHVKKGGL